MLATFRVKSVAHRCVAMVVVSPSTRSYTLAKAAFVRVAFFPVYDSHRDTITSQYA